MLTAPEFDPKRYDIKFDHEEDEFICRDLEEGCVYSVTPHAMAVLYDENYRMACFATRQHVQKTFN
jgi:hypothetical protein